MTLPGLVRPNNHLRSSLRSMFRLAQRGAGFPGDLRGFRETEAILPLVFMQGAIYFRLSRLGGGFQLTAVCFVRARRNARDQSFVELKCYSSQPSVSNVPN
jgi:hypothetical protein